MTPTPIPPIHIWPNPFNPDFGSGYLHVSNVPTGTSLDLYTVSGEKVISVPEIGGNIQWDGRNKGHWMTATGLYYYVIKNGSQVLLTGKLLVITGK